MPITLDDALERAKIMSGTDGLLSQQSYQLLYNALDDKDRFAFNMALVDHGIIAKSANVDVKELRKSVLGKLNTQIRISEVIDSDNFIREKLERAGQRILRAQFDVDESGQVTYGGEAEPEASQVDQQEVDKLRSTLENLGLSVSQDGKVSFYKSSIPGVYSDRLPQSMPLDTAVGYYQQISRTAANEEQRASQLLDYLSQLSSNAETVENVLANLKNYRFNEKSSNDLVKGIAQGLSSLSGFYSNGKKDDLLKTLESLKGQVEQYRFDQGAKADQYETSADALNRLKDYQTNDPDFYNAVVKGLGGV